LAVIGHPAALSVLVASMDLIGVSHAVDRDRGI
jgi:hypothetical protein